MLQWNGFMETKMLLYGAGGHAKVILECLDALGVEVIGLFDDNPSVIDFFNLKVFHGYKKSIHPDIELIVSVGNNRIRAKLVSMINHSFGQLIHTSAQISKWAKIGCGSVVFQNSVIQPSAEIGKHCIVNTSSVVEHDCILQNFVHISPHTTLSGGVNVGEGTHVGAGAIVIPGITVGKWVTIGAGAVVIKDVPAFAIVVGNPAKIIKYQNYE